MVGEDWAWLLLLAGWRGGDWSGSSWSTPMPQWCR